jgi:hypothetical protein
MKSHEAISNPLFTSSHILYFSLLVLIRKGPLCYILMSGELARGPLYYDKNGAFCFLLAPSVVKKKKSVVKKRVSDWLLKHTQIH